MKIKRIGKTLLCTAAAALFGVALSPSALSARADVSPALFEVDGVSYRYFDEALSAWGQGTTMKLLENCTLTGLMSAYSEPLGLTHLSVTESKTLDLNGKTLTGTKGSSVIYVTGEGVTFTLTDTSSSKSGAVTGGDAVFGGGIAVSGATLNFQGGSVSGNTGVSGGGIYVNEGTVEFGGGTVKGNKADFGGGIYLLGSTLNMKNGASDVTGNTAVAFGGGVYAYGEKEVPSVLTVESGKIHENSAQNGGGIALWKNATLNLSGSAEISKNTAQSGGGVYLFGDEENVGIRDSRFYMTGGAVSSNTATDSLGGGIKVGRGGLFQMTGGTISGNTAVGGGGVSVDGGAEAVFGGTASVKQNLRGENADNVSFFSDSILSLKDDFSGEIGFNCSSYGVICKDYKGSTKGVTADDPAYEIFFENGMLTVGMQEPTGIFIETLPTKLDYTLNDTPDFAGMVVKATYKDGHTAEIRNYTVDSAPFTKSNTVRQITYTVNGTAYTAQVSFRVDGVSAGQGGAGQGGAGQSNVFEGGFIAVVVLSGLFLIALVFVGIYTDGFKGKRQKKEKNTEHAE